MPSPIGPEISVIQKISVAIIHERNVEKLLENVLGILESELGMLRGTFALLFGDTLKIEASRGLDESEKQKGSYRMGEGITGHVAERGVSHVIPDLRKDSRFLNRTGSRHYDSQVAFICVPLIHDGDVIGTLSIDRPVDGSTDLDRDVALLEIIANITGDAANECIELHNERETMLEENRRLRDMLSNNPGELVGNCREMQMIYEQVRQVAPSDVFYKHLKLNDLIVTGVTGDTKMKHATAPVSIVTPQTLHSTASTNIIDAIAKQPGVSQITTGSGISKPIIRGLGYNRVVVMSEGVRQEGQQWGDEHGVEVDGNAVNSVEILKGPASLMYGSDAMAGVVILHAEPTLAEGEMKLKAGTEYQTNNGLFAYNLAFAGNQKGFVWNARFSDKMAHAYKNKYDGYVPGSQFRERAGRLMLGLNKEWGHSRLTWTTYHLTPSIIEGERDEETGDLIANYSPIKSYSKALPFQQVKHYKLVWDNSLNLSSGYLKAIIGYQQNRRQEFEESADEYELYFKMHTLTYDVRYITNEWDGWKLSTGVGGMYQHSLNKGEEYLIPDYKLFDLGVYATVTKSINDKWTMNGGVRYDYRRLHGYGLLEDGEVRFNDFCRHFNGLTGSIGAVCNINEQWNLRLNVARGFRTPNMSELASNGVHEGSIRYELGSERLKAEYSLQADLGLDFSSPYVSAQLALFANRIDNYIFTHRLPVVIEDGYLTYAYTQGDARLLGFEAGIDFHPIHSVHFGNTFSYVDAQLMNEPEDTRYLPFTPAPRWTSELKWELMHHSHTTVGHHQHGNAISNRLRLNNLYVSAGMDFYFRQNHIYRADETETETPSYALLNLQAGTDIQIGRKKIAEFYIIADNLLDNAYQNHLSRLKYADFNAVTGRQGVYNMGRNITMKLIIPIDL